MALEAKRVAFGAKQVVNIAAVGGMAGGASLSEGGLVVDGLFAQIVHIRVAAEADGDGIGFGQAGLIAGVGAMAIGAIAHGSGVGNFGGIDELGLVVVAGDAEGFYVWLG